MYFDEVKEEDNRNTDAWKEDASSIVIFVTLNLLIPVFISITSFKTGLFSAIVGAFIIEFYKKLSTDSGNQTVALLQQISHQLPNSPNSANSNTVNQLSPPGTAMVWVNILWLTSLVLSLTCALIATLLQQWARRYIETPKSADVLRHRARVRSLLLVGARLYKIRLIVEILPTLLHLSVFLFFGGLVIAFHTIHKTVAITVDVAVGLLGLAYIAMSILPCLDVRCPYRTPISQMLWYPCHAFLSFAALCLHSCIRGLEGFLSQNLVLSRGQRWLASRGLAASDHRRYFTDGLEKSIVSRAVQMLKDGDCRRVTWLFNQLALGDRSKFLKFAASIPRHRIPDLILSTELNSLPLVSLLVLLRSCVTGTYSWAGEDICKRSLLVCLHAIRHIAKAPTLPDLDFMQAHLANTDHMAALVWNNDSFIRTTSRSICALVARKVVRKRRLGEADLHWLQVVIGESRDAILEASVTVRDQMNFKAFVIGVLPHPLSKLSTEDAAIFNETLAILLNERTNGQNYTATSDWQNQLSEEIERIHQYDPEDGRKVFDRLHAMFPSLVAPFLSSAEARYPTSPPVAPPPAVTAGNYDVPSTPSPVPAGYYYGGPQHRSLPPVVTMRPPRCTSHPFTAGDYYAPSTLAPPPPVVPSMPPLHYRSPTFPLPLPPPATRPVVPPAAPPTAPVCCPSCCPSCSPPAAPLAAPSCCPSRCPTCYPFRCPLRCPSRCPSGCPTRVAPPTLPRVAPPTPTRCHPSCSPSPSYSPSYCPFYCPSCNCSSPLTYISYSFISLSLFCTSLWLSPHVAHPRCISCLLPLQLTLCAGLPPHAGLPPCTASPLRASRAISPPSAPLFLQVQLTIPVQPALHMPQFRSIAMCFT